MAAEAEPGKRVRGKRPPEGEPVIDRALALFAAFDAGHRRRDQVPVRLAVQRQG